MSSSAKQRLIDWANAQEHWVRALVGDAFATGKPGIDAAFDAMLVEKELLPGTLREAPPLVAGETTEDAGEALRLEKLRDVSGVNALAERQQLSFHPRLTVVFGENAAGKSGYVRILKRLAAVRSAEDVLPDFRLEDEPTPSASVDYTLGGTPQTLQWHDEAGVAPFTRMSVFDSRAVSLHVDEDLTYVFTPASLQLYKTVHQAVDAVRAKLDARIAEVRARPNPFLVHFRRDAVVFPKLEALAATSLEELAALSVLTAVEAERLEGLKRRAEQLRPETSKVLLQAAVADVDLYGTLSSVAGLLRTFDWKGWADAHVRAKEEAKAKPDDESPFGDDEIAGAEGEAWRGFLEAAEAYLHEVGEKTYPHRGDECLYCREPLKAAGVTRVKRYRKFVEGSAKHSTQTAAADVDRRRAALRTIPVQGLLQSVVRRVQALDEVPQVLRQTQPLIELATKLQQAPGDASELVKLAAQVEQAALEQKQSAEALIASLKKQAQEKQSEAASTAAELATLENRKLLQAHLGEIDTYLSRTKWAAAAAAVSTRITSVLRQVTEQSKAANEEALNQDFEKLFLAECAALRAPAVEVDFAGRKGQAARKKVLSRAHRLSELLSEGEQKVIALADFLAEVSLRASPAPIVFDDPVNSLDHKRMEHVVERLVQLSAERQVVVFTHNVWFAASLARRSAGEAQLWGIRAEAGQTGLVSAMAPQALFEAAGLGK